MIEKFRFGKPFATESVVTEIPVSEGTPSFGAWRTTPGFSFTYIMDERDMVFGLGEAMRGINKRGHLYISDCKDDDDHVEHKNSLYAAHNFIVISRESNAVGIYFDDPSKLVFDIGYTRSNVLTVSNDHADLDVYLITCQDVLSVVRQFRRIIGQSYIAPRFAFGFGQSRWGYENADDIRRIVKEHRSKHVPIDMVYMDIDYMVDYKDFTVNEERFPDFAGFVKEMQEEHIHLVPIIDAGVKIEPGYQVYEEGIEKGYFCKKKDGSEFEAVVWPGLTHFPDVLNKDARVWFGDWYRVLLDYGIDGFWNDMNEPAIFYTPEGVDALRSRIDKIMSGEDDTSIDNLSWICRDIKNRAEDYANFYHNVNGEMVCHKDVHNLFGYNMTRAAGEAFERLAPDRRILMFSRSSYIGMHRYGGVWMGDNKSWWSHLLLNLKMLPSLNMCGFLYCGADLGGFGENTTRDLMLRWLALGVFTPLMRNHSAKFTREQEFYQFEGTDDFRAVLNVRYRLLPYLYSEYVKAATENDMLFKPLCFVYPQDEIARNVEDQLMLGNECMIAPVYTQNATGRMVYLPEDMTFVKFLPDGSIASEELEKGLHFVAVALNEVPLFIKKGFGIPVAKAAEYSDAVDDQHMTMLGDADYRYYIVQ